MKILQINKFFYPKGGAETYFLSLKKLLEKNGQEIFVFSQDNEKNLPSPEKNHFISDINLEKFSWKNIWRIGRIFWSPEACRKIKKLIEEKKPDLVHIHNIYHQISPSILKTIKKFGLPIVMTVHDFKLITPAYTLRADGKKMLHKNSFLAHFLLFLEFNFHKLIGIYKNNVDLFIAPSDFVKNKLIENNFDGKKIIVLPHFASSEKMEEQESENYILFFGRLDEGKGLDILIRAFAQIKNPNIKLKIAGAGPEEKNLKKLVCKLGIENRVEFAGLKKENELKEIIKKCLFTIFPSRVHETFGLGILESYACQKPVIASRAGSFSEIVRENQTGLLFEVDNIGELREKMENLLQNSEKIKLMGELAYQKIQIENDPDIHYDKIMKIYKSTSS